MNKKNIEIIITSILIIALLIGAVRAVLAVKRVKKIPAPAVKLAEVVSSSKLMADEKLLRIETEADKLNWDRNPFARSRAPGSAGINQVNLTGIMWDDKVPQAIIGEEVVKEGDVIGKYKIIKINKNSVIISSDEGEKTLNIWEE